jgi:hypothetical protein
VEVAGAGSGQVDGRYVRDKSGELEHLGVAFRRSRDEESSLYHYVLLHEEVPLRLSPA